ncbi:hypothetical protein EAE96_009075 [Botrytis aclada]|nr:hypothetical protein EAE96_009075 [Botrytis aclada]
MAQCIKPAIGNGMKYCAQHKCLDRNCNMQPCANMRWCPEHKTRLMYFFPPDLKCIKQNCHSLRVGSASTCPAHKCQDPACGNCQFDLSRSCVSHKCHHNGCLRKRWTDSHVYCDHHVCALYSYPYCLNLKDLTGGRVFCQSHNCSKPGCLSSRIDNMNLCEDHARVN